MYKLKEYIIIKPTLLLKSTLKFTKTSQSLAVNWNKTLLLTML